MNRMLVTFAVALTMAGVAQGVPQGGAQKEIVIKDKAEAAAYRAADSTADPAAKAAAMEAFSKRYPKSAVYVDALEQAMAAYQQTGNMDKVEEIAGQILGANPDNIRALAIVCLLDRTKAAQGSADALKATGEYCAKGLQALPKWQKPDDMADQLFKLMHDQTWAIFNGGSGFAALQRKDYVAARDFYLQALQVDSYDVINNYQISLAYFSMEPMDPVGIWYATVAGHVARGKGEPAGEQILAFAKSKYVKYHGSEDGWFEFSTSKDIMRTTPPNPLGIKPAPAP